MKQLLASVAVALGLLGPAATAGVCFPREVMVRSLLERHQERQVAVGLARNGYLLELFATKNGRTWTLVMTSPQNVSCVVGAGDFLEIVGQGDLRA